VTVYRPPNWAGDDFAPVSADRPDGGVDLTVEVTRGDANTRDEFNRIETNMHRSLPNAVISRIERVQNENLWAKYFLARSDIAKSKEFTFANELEIEAWHSTNITDPRLICSDWKVGLDVNRSIIDIKYQRNASGNLDRYPIENIYIYIYILNLVWVTFWATSISYFGVSKRFVLCSNSCQ
jgi:hypothetical protein